VSSGQECLNENKSKHIFFSTGAEGQKSDDGNTRNVKLFKIAAISRCPSKDAISAAFPFREPWVLTRKNEGERCHFSEPCHIFEAAPGPFQLKVELLATQSKHQLHGLSASIRRCPKKVEFYLFGLLHESLQKIFECRTTMWVQVMMSILPNYIVAWYDTAYDTREQKRKRIYLSFVD